MRPISGRYCVRSARTLAKLTRFRGAKRGANVGRHWATPGHVQPLSVQLNATSGHTRQRRATCGECLLSSRPQVRILLGAHFRVIFRFCAHPGRACRGANRLALAAAGPPKGRWSATTSQPFLGQQVRILAAPGGATARPAASRLRCLARYLSRLGHNVILGPEIPIRTMRNPMTT